VVRRPGPAPIEFLQPGSWAEALAVKAARPAALPLAGGTDVMVDLNFDRARPEAILDLGRVGELTGFVREDGWLRLGARLTYTEVIEQLGDVLPGLAIASRTVGSPQIRNRGTIGGNLGSASPAGDAHPPLLAGAAQVEVASVRGSRRVPVAEFFTGPKRSALEPDELVAAVHVPAADRFAELVAAAAQPIDDVRGSAAYRRHALGVLARRALGWAWDRYRRG
jgi:CO/xanthine dehydrogenase FAD-binding subunit